MLFHFFGANLILFCLEDLKNLFPILDILSNCFLLIPWLIIWKKPTSTHAFSIFYFIIGDGQYNTSNHPASQFIFREWFVDLEFSILLMVTTGITATLAFLLLFSAYSVASPSVVSPFEYSILLWSSLIGWLYFNEVPSLTTVIGIFIIVSSGIYIFMREKIQDQSIVTEKPLR